MSSSPTPWPSSDDPRSNALDGEGAAYPSPWAPQPQWSQQQPGIPDQASPYLGYQAPAPQAPPYGANPGPGLAMGHPAPASPPSSPTPGIVMTTGGGLVALGSFLPWASLGPFSASGLDGDGVITLVLGVIVLGMGIVWLTAGGKRWLPVVALVSAVLITLVAGYDSMNISTSEPGPFGAELSVGSGLWLTLLGGIVAATGSVLGLLRRRPQPSRA